VVDVIEFINQVNIEQNKTNIELLNNIIENNSNIKKNLKHIIQLSNDIKKVDGFVTLSSNSNRIKIKCHSFDRHVIGLFRARVIAFAKKYKIDIEESSTNIFYIS
jgi:hypothetical protein